MRKNQILRYAIVLAVGPHHLSPAVESPTLGNEVAVGLLPSSEKIERLARDLGIARRIVHAHDERRITQVERVIVEFIDRLDVVVADLIAGDQVINKVRAEGIIYLLLGNRNLDSARQQRVPELNCPIEIIIELSRA